MSSHDGKWKKKLCLKYYKAPTGVMKMCLSQADHILTKKETLNISKYSGL